MVSNGGNVDEGYAITAYGAAPILSIRVCNVSRPPTLPQEETMQGGTIVRVGSCNEKHAPSPYPFTQSPFVGGGCGRGGLGCGMGLQRSAHRPMFVRPPGAPLNGNTTVHILGDDLGSIRMCQFLMDGMPFGQGLATAVQFDAAGFSCTVPPIWNISLFSGYDRGSVSQRATIRLSEDGQHFFDTPLDFVYYRQPILSSAVYASSARTPFTTVAHLFNSMPPLITTPLACSTRIGSLLCRARFLDHRMGLHSSSTAAG